MFNKRNVKYVLVELRAHAPFTMLGASLGILFMLLFQQWLAGDRSVVLFGIFHPGHVFLSAVTTTAMFKIYSGKVKFLFILLIGYVGSVGIATVSDSVIPYAGEILLGVHVEGHGHGHSQVGGEGEHDGAAAMVHSEKEEYKHGMHIGFLEEWYVVNPAAFSGILLGWCWPRTKIPHFGHILLSIWASLFHVLMAINGTVSVGQWVGIGFFLFLAVWLPCCVSDIVFPLLLVKGDPALVPHHHN